jgi:hypothetical protein
VATPTSLSTIFPIKTGEKRAKRGDGGEHKRKEGLETERKKEKLREKRNKRTKKKSREKQRRKKEKKKDHR